MLGELQTAIVEALWRHGEGTAADVCARLGPGHNYKTVSTVLNRLVNKKVLSRRREGRVYVYAPLMEREEFLATMSRGVFEGLVRDLRGAAVAQFVDVLDEVAPEQLAELERLLRARRER